jgi:hypothetical protein
VGYSVPNVSQVKSHDLGGKLLREATHTRKLKIVKEIAVNSDPDANALSTLRVWLKQ